MAVSVVPSLFPAYHTLVTGFATDQGQFKVQYWPHNFGLLNCRHVLSQRDFPGLIANPTVVATLSVDLVLPFQRKVVSGLTAGGLAG